MKKMVFSAILLLSTLSTISLKAQDSTKVTLAKAAELSLHRLERLVILKKVDLNFQDKFKYIKIRPLESNPEDIAFHSDLQQYPDSAGEKSTLSIFMNEDGKTLKHTVSAKGVAAQTPSWPDKDPVTLSENALHFVLEEGEKGTQSILPFYNALNYLEINQLKEADGSIKALVKMKSSRSSNVLEVKMNADGTFNSHQIDN